MCLTMAKIFDQHVFSNKGRSLWKSSSVIFSDLCLGGAKGSPNSNSSPQAVEKMLEHQGANKLKLSIDINDLNG